MKQRLKRKKFKGTSSTSLSFLFALNSSVMIFVIRPGCERHALPRKFRRTEKFLQRRHSFLPVRVVHTNVKNPVVPCNNAPIYKRRTTNSFRVQDRPGLSFSPANRRCCDAVEERRRRRSAAANKPGKKRDAQDHRVEDETRRGERKSRDLKFMHAGLFSLTSRSRRKAGREGERPSEALRCSPSSKGTCKLALPIRIRRSRRCKSPTMRVCVDELEDEDEDSR